MSTQHKCQVPASRASYSYQRTRTTTNEDCRIHAQYHNPPRWLACPCVPPASCVQCIGLRTRPNTFMSTPRCRPSNRSSCAALGLTPRRPAGAMALATRYAVYRRAGPVGSGEELMLGSADGRHRSNTPEPCQGGSIK
eukprot:1461786-Pleurochrysis_carterae.AAC.5